jgi:hypothetical protein
MKKDVDGTSSRSCQFGVGISDVIMSLSYCGTS